MLTTLQNTLLKPLPKQFADIAPNQIVSVPAGKKIAFDACSKKSGHFLIEETFYLFASHVERDGNTLTATQDTVLKPSIAQASAISPEHLIDLQAGKTILAYKGCATKTPTNPCSG